MKLYSKTRIHYIPNRLHRKGRKVCNRFYLNEEIYRRCPTINVESPFATISLTDLSLNRQGNPRKRNPFSLPDDVLLNHTPHKGGAQPYLKESFVVLKIKRLSKNKTYKKVLQNQGNTLIVKLKHDPTTSNYSHSVFELILNNIVVLHHNYKTSLGGNGYKILRQNCRLEIQRMIIRREIR